MKKINIISNIFIALFLVGLISCSNQNDSGKITSDLVNNPSSASEKTKNNLPVIAFESQTHDFGIIIEGEKVPWTFKFKNTGGSDLIIADVSTTCGCTIPKWSRKPIKPGDEGKIDVVFNSSNRAGSNNKSITVMTNSQPNTVELKIIAEVYSPKKNK